MEVTYYPLKLLHMCGQTLEGNHVVHTISQGTLLTFWFVLGVLKPIMFNEGFQGLLGAFDTISPFIQWTAKMFVYIYHKKAIRKLHEDQKEFWTYNTFGKKIENKLKTRSKYISRFFKMYIILAAITIILMTLKPLTTFGSTRQLPVPIYHIVDFTKTPYFIMAYLLYIWQSYITLFFICGFDGLFMTFLAAAAFQLMLLKHGLSSIKVDTRADAIMSYNVLKKYIKHHCFILQFINEMKDIFTYYLMTQFLMSTMSVCTPIFLFYKAGVSDAVSLLRYVGYSLACVFQIFLYCVTGNQLKIEMESVADAMYESDWWKTDIYSIRQAALLIIQRSNNDASLKAGGMVELDLPSFIKVLRMSFSFFTLMQSSEVKKCNEI